MGGATKQTTSKIEMHFAFMLSPTLAFILTSSADSCCRISRCIRRPRGKPSDRRDALNLKSAGGGVSGWVVGIPEGVATVRVSVTHIPIEHAVKMRDFMNWVERKGGSPKQVSDRARIRAILGLPR